MEINCTIFNPLNDLNQIRIYDTEFNDWYDYIVITKDLSEKLGYNPEIRKQKVSVPGGMKVELPVIQIGITIGSFVLKNQYAYIVDSGINDLILGKNILSSILSSNKEKQGKVEFTDEIKDDPTALSLKLHSLDGTYPMINFERFLYNQRKLYNTLLVMEGEVVALSKNEVVEIIENDKGISQELALKITWIENGSIWMTIKSAGKALKEFGKIFGEAKLANLKKDFYDAQKNKTESEILKETSKEIIEKKKAEEERIKTENIHKTHNIWRMEMLKRMEFFEKMSAKVEDPEIKKELKKQFESSIQNMLIQNLYPEVKNIPDENNRIQIESYNRYLLPPSNSDMSDFSDLLDS
ncbi:MAG: retroviral-like aspartic protease family protein [Bacteroidetes bacterium]|nr:retroviral-like aspartic protease family protein [Bacteroidota bacterium]